MSERRTPYTTRSLPRARLPHPAASELDAENEALVKQSIARAEENSDLRQRLAALETAARAVCEPHECIGLLFRAIEELGRLVEVKTL